MIDALDIMAFVVFAVLLVGNTALEWHNDDDQVQLVSAGHRTRGRLLRGVAASDFPFQRRAK